MTGSYRNLLWILPLGVLASSPLWKGYAVDFLKPRGGYDETAEKAYQEQPQDFVMDDVKIIFTSEGLQTWTIKADQARTGETDREIDMHDVNALYHKKGASPLTITSRTGKYHMDDHQLTLTEDVVIIKPLQHEELYSDLLHYYDTSKMLISPGDVEIRGPKFNLQAGRMDYDIATGAYNFSRRVKVLL